MADIGIAELEARLDEAYLALRTAEEQRDAGAERAALLHGELQHRVRNMLATIRSIFSRTVASGGSLETVADHFRGRLDAISRYQIPRGAAAASGIDFETLLRDELQPFAFGEDERISLAGPDVAIPYEISQYLALAMHELATNAIKFGALSDSVKGARLRVTWSTDGATFHLRWEESGVSPMAIAPMRTGFGREFLEQGLPYQFGAETRFEMRPGGIACDIAVRLDEPVRPKQLF